MTLWRFGDEVGKLKMDTMVNVCWRGRERGGGGVQGLGLAWSGGLGYQDQHSRVQARRIRKLMLTDQVDNVL